jgi:hypothetical protein
MNFEAAILILWGAAVCAASAAAREHVQLPGSADVLRLVEDDTAAVRGIEGMGWSPQV